jgi:hypothetical protein
VLAGLAGCAALTALSAEASAQEIQLTGPLAGAPAVRKLRLHRKGRFELAPGVSFTLLDEYQRTIMPGAALTYHFTDWLGVGLWGGFGFQYSTGLTDELQEKAIDARDCANRATTKSCKLTAVNLTRRRGQVTLSNGNTAEQTGQMGNDQLGRIQWVVSPQVTFVPFRGKLALFSSLFVDTDVNIFAGPAIIGLQERAACGRDNDGNSITPCADAFGLAGRVTVAPSFGFGLNFYPGSFVGFGVEWRALPMVWNTSGFDNYGGGNNEDFPDNAVNSADREFHFNSMLTLHVNIQLPTQIRTTD